MFWDGTRLFIIKSNQVRKNQSRTSNQYSSLSAFSEKLRKLLAQNLMKATTTVITSSYYGNTAKTSEQNPMNAFISPQQMLRRLIPYANVQKDKQNMQPVKQQTEYQTSSRNGHISDIEHLQTQLNNIHAQVIESQNLLNVRDSLYGQLDMLRDERQQIESDVSYLQNNYPSSKQVRVSVKANHGYKEMNQRLRRRMNEVREYIHKMELQNQKIAENINYTNMLNVEKNYRTQQQSVDSNWVDNAYFAERQRSAGRVDDMIARLHAKQDQALQRVRRQQDEINRRNQMNRASFGAIPVMGSQMQMGTPMGARSFYGQSVQTSGGRRFYSPDYRY